MIRRSRIVSILFLMLMPATAVAQVLINEVLYDAPGSDSGREWVELYNVSGTALDLSEWKFVEGGTNHTLVLFQGTSTLSAGAFAIIVNDPQKFLTGFPGFSGTIFDSSFSLSNVGETLALKNKTVLVDQVAYSALTGAAGDGNTIGRFGTNWLASVPTPAAVNIQAPAKKPVPGPTESSNTQTPVSLKVNSARAFVVEEVSTSTAVNHSEDKVVDQESATESGMFKWLLLLAGVIVIAVASFLMLRHDTGDTGYTIVEDKS